ncbi:RNA polymerase sigma factor [Rathayibacter festucae]|uniref:RNA polymerase sigma factor n=1 Tax=Rathayibacter TaxID=33886 RepID=UPI000F4BE940|nr:MULTISPECIES: RNA polymerase sigma factor [Rathayibacter]MCJ1699981.1 RNA polymerase sigma factor [Rathayibacter festucae]ROQ64186.1 RNA polymerase sigma-70 factor (ECF subfamily) [Rathayibacter sp. PhB152]
MSIRSRDDFSELYRAQYDDVLRFVRRRAPAATVDDIVGETFLAAWRRRHELPENARPWLFGTARNAILNAARGENRQQALAVRIGTLATEERADPSINDRLDLESAWKRLPLGEQEALALHVWEDLPQADAAQVLGCSRAAYAMRLTRAKRRLAALLAATEPSLLSGTAERTL